MNLRLIIFSAITLLAACNQKGIQNTNDLTLLLPVETLEPNSKEKKPAFSGQTRAAGIKTQMNIVAQVHSDQLKQPWGITPLVDGKLIITEKEGSLRIFDISNQNLSEKIWGLPTVVNEAQGGLLDVAVSPNFNTDKVIFVSFSELHPEGTLTAVAKATLSDDLSKIVHSEVIYRAFPAFDSRLHYGSRIEIDAQGNLFVSTGERSDIRSRPQAQELNSGLGKIVHITPEGKPVADNPFIKTTNAQPEIYSYGHRNVQSLAFDNEGNLWEAEFGPRGGDELNSIEKGKNYGWPTITYGIEYSGKIIGENLTQKEGLEQPVYYWDPVVSPSGMIFYNEGPLSEWKGNLLIGTLSGQHLLRLVLRDKKVFAEERLLTDLKERFRDITVGDDGWIYLITDSGKLISVRLK